MVNLLVDAITAYGGASVVFGREYEAIQKEGLEVFGDDLVQLALDPDIVKQAVEVKKNRLAEAFNVRALPLHLQHCLDRPVTCVQRTTAVFASHTAGLADKYFLHLLTQTSTCCSCNGILTGVMIALLQAGDGV